MSDRDRDDEWRAPIWVVAGLLVQDDVMLMQHRPAGRTRPLLWENPGGKVESGEDPRAALAREWREELGIDVIVERRVSVARLLVESTIVVDLYTVMVLTGSPRPLHATELRWVRPLDAIRDLPCAPATYAFYRDIRNYMEGR